MIMTNNDSLSLLCIGNSFSDDAVDYLFPILKDHGVKELHIGNLYIGGCSLERHYKNIRENIPDYSYRVYRYDGLDDHPDYTLEKALLERKWDVLTLQQYSGHSGCPDTYGDLGPIIEYLRGKCPNPDFRLLWQMTWAYQADSDHWDFPLYGNDQKKMLQAIIDTVKEKVLPTKQFAGIIPSGIAVQNLRGSRLGDTLTRDGFHMSFDVGRFLVSLTWAYTLYGYFPISEIKTAALPEKVKANLDIIEEAAKKAIEYRF